MARFTGLARASLSPSGPSPLPPYRPRIPTVVPSIRDRGYYGGDTGGLAPGQQGEGGQLGRRDAGPGVASWQSYSRIHLAARHFRCPRFPASRLRPIVLGAPNPYSGFSQAWLAVEHEASGPISELVMHLSLILPPPFNKLICDPALYFRRCAQGALVSGPTPGGMMSHPLARPCQRVLLGRNTIGGSARRTSHTRSRVSSC